MSAVTSTSFTTTMWFTMRATGVVALILLSATMVLGMLTAGRTRSRSWPAFVQADLHKRISLVAMVFLAIHVLSAVLDTYVHVGLASALLPFASSYRPLWTGLGTVAVDLMVAVAVSSALRQRISARTWRGIHWLAYGSWPVAMAHTFGMGTDAATLWLDAIGVLCTVAVLGALVLRVRDHQRSRAGADAVGAVTRAITRPVAPTVAATPGAVGRSSSATSATRLLERKRS